MLYAAYRVLKWVPLLVDLLPSNHYRQFLVELSYFEHNVNQAVRRPSFGLPHSCKRLDLLLYRLLVLYVDLSNSDLKVIEFSILLFLPLHLLFFQHLLLLNLVSSFFLLLI